jgi:hypothetical protein
MNTVRIGVITIWAAVGVSGYLSLRGAATDEQQPEQVLQARKVHVAAGDPIVGRHTAQAPDKPAIEAGVSELPQRSQTLDEVLEAVNADIGPAGEYVDREAFAAVLRSDPELSRLLDESEF